MNIFYLDSDPKKCAQYHCDKHVVKMIVETAQILCSVHWIAGSWKNEYYVPTHLNHPCVKWVAESIDNYNWLVSLGVELCKEYKFRYGKTHKTESLILQLVSEIPSLESKGITKAAEAMPPYCKKENPIKSYREYYLKEKKHLLKYKRRQVPEWTKG